MQAAFYNTEIPPGVPAAHRLQEYMDKFEEIGKRIDAEMERLRRYVDEEIAPETERRTASFLRDVSGKLDEFAAKIEARMSRRTPPPPPQDPQS
jgi:molecular chaperone GrpE (heat shock protein)